MNWLPVNSQGEGETCSLTRLTVFSRQRGCLLWGGGQEEEAEGLPWEGPPPALRDWRRGRACCAQCPVMWDRRPLPGRAGRTPDLLPPYPFPVPMQLGRIPVEEHPRLPPPWRMVLVEEEGGREEAAPLK